MDLHDLEEQARKMAEKQGLQVVENRQPVSDVAESVRKELSTADDVIKQQQLKDLQKISENEEFRNASLQLNTRTVASKLDEEANKVLDKELQNELDKYRLKKIKEELDYRQKKEKRIVKQQVRADVKATKRRIAEQRFGYLYTPDGTYTYKDKDGNDVTTTKYKNFTPSWTINKMKEVSNWYKNQTETVQKMIWHTVKFVIFGGAGVGVCFLLYKVVRWLAASGALNTII